MSNTGQHEFKAFLRNRRGRIAPGKLSFPVEGRRRLTWLRREDVAIAAALSSDHYQRIEQGRSRASAAALDVIASGVSLDSLPELPRIFQTSTM